MSSMWQRIKGMTKGQSWPSFSLVTNLFTKGNYRDLNQETEHGLDDDPVVIANTDESNAWMDVTDAGCRRRNFSPVHLDDVENYDRISLSSTKDTVYPGHRDFNGRTSNGTFSARIFGADSNLNDSSGKLVDGENGHNGIKIKCDNGDIGRKYGDIKVEHRHGDSNERSGQGDVNERSGQGDVNERSGQGDVNERSGHGGINERSGHDDINERFGLEDINGRYDHDDIKGKYDNEYINEEYGRDEMNEVKPHVFSPYSHENNQRKIISPRQLSSSIQEGVTGVVHVVKQRRYSKLDEDSDEIEELHTEATVPEEMSWHDTFPVPKQKAKSIGRSRSNKVWKKTRKAVRVTWKWFKRSFVSFNSSANYGVPINVAIYGGSRHRGRRYFYDYR